MKQWYAVHTRPFQEKKVMTYLTKKGFDAYLPVAGPIITKWIARKKKKQAIVFPSLVFVCVTEEARRAVMQVSGVLNFFHWLNKPVTLKDDEIEMIQRFLTVYQRIEVKKTRVDPSAVVQLDGDTSWDAGEKETGVLYLSALGCILSPKAEEINEKHLRDGPGYPGAFYPSPAFG